MTNPECVECGGRGADVMPREVGSSRLPLCARCADRRRALGRQIVATRPAYLNGGDR